MKSKLTSILLLLILVQFSNLFCQKKYEFPNSQEVLFYSEINSNLNIITRNANYEYSFYVFNEQNELILNKEFGNDPIFQAFYLSSEKMILIYQTDQDEEFFMKDKIVAINPTTNAILWEKISASESYLLSPDCKYIMSRANKHSKTTFNVFSTENGESISVPEIQNTFLAHWISNDEIMLFEPFKDFDNSGLNEDMAEIEKKIKELNQKKSLLQGEFKEGKISKSDYKTKSSHIVSEIGKLLSWQRKAFRNRDRHKDLPNKAFIKIIDLKENRITKQSYLTDKDGNNLTILPYQMRTYITQQYANKVFIICRDQQRKNSFVVSINHDGEILNSMPLDYIGSDQMISEVTINKTKFYRVLAEEGKYYLINLENFSINEGDIIEKTPRISKLDKTFYELDSYTENQRYIIGASCNYFIMKN